MHYSVTFFVVQFRETNFKRHSGNKKNDTHEHAKIKTLWTAEALFQYILPHLITIKF
mgnify:CR=1 FL=1